MKDPALPGAHDWRRDAAVVAAFVPLALLATWPLALGFTTRLAGNQGDNWQSLWNFVHLQRSLAAGQSPLFTHDLWHPDGATLVFQTFDWPDAIFASALLPTLGPIAAFNVVYVWIFASCGMAMYACSRILGASRRASFLSGCAFTFTTFHFGHAVGHLHIIAMQWVPLAVACGVKVFEGRGWRWGLAGGFFLGLSALSSWYHLLSAGIVLATLAGAWAMRRCTGWRRVLPAVAVYAAVAIAVFGPLLVAVVHARDTDPVAGAHEAWVFSSDLESFVFPNELQGASRWSDRYRAWTGNGAENANHFGNLLMLVCLGGLGLRAPRVGVWLAAAVAGAALSLGPRLHLGGALVTGDVLPYAWLVKALPFLAFSGVPVRFGEAAVFAFAAALAPTLDAVAARASWKVAAPLALLALFEHFPRPFSTSAFPTPSPMAAWAQDGRDWAVLDTTSSSRAFWHQILHGHPMIGGYLTRTPQRLEDRLSQDPVLWPLWEPVPPMRSVPFAAPTIEFGAFDTPVVPGADHDAFSMALDATLLVTAAGERTFGLESDDDGELFVDGVRVVDNRGVHVRRLAAGSVSLAAGPHALRLLYTQRGGYAWLSGWVAGPDGVRKPLDSQLIPEGWRGTAEVRRRQTRLGAEDAISHLRALKVRYVVQPAGDSGYLVDEQLRLRRVYEGDGLRISEVPDP